MHFSTIILTASTALAATITSATNPYATYPPVPKTASINGFADRIYGELPSCAKECVKRSTSNTPCPYWDTGCLCVMPNFGGPIAECFASSCKGENVKSASSLAVSACSVAGVWDPYWIIPATASSALAAAETAA